MQLSEYKSKEILRQYGVAVPAGRLARTVRDAGAACEGLGARRYVVKAQIAAGGRGLAGGIKFAATPSSVEEEAGRMLGSRLATAQTGPEGDIVNAVCVEAALDLKRQVFIAIALDPDSGLALLLASSEGGIHFEERARMDAETVRTFSIPEDDTKARGALEEFLAGLGIAGIGPVDAVLAARRAFIENDMSLLEINPFAETGEGWVAIDAKVVIDDNAMFRHPEFEAFLADQRMIAPESEAQQNNINFVKLDGDIGVIVNGAGLGLATNDMLIDADGRPANFMDIRTTAKSFDIARGVDILLRDPSVSALLLNVHGGGMTVCDTVAEGVAFAYARSSRKPPLAARLAGQNAEWGLKILKDRAVPVTVFDDIRAAVKGVVEMAAGRRR